MYKKSFTTFYRLFFVIVCVYLFLVSIGLMSVAFKGFGKEFAENLIKATSNPFIGLFIGLLATSMVQSSSTTTSIVVGMVGAKVITISNAIPIIMGANIGTTVTAVLVSLCHVTRREEFKRAITGATVHDFFNILCVAVLFPLQLATGFLDKLATKMSLLFVDIGGIKFTSPVKAATEPIVEAIKNFFMSFHISKNVTYIAILAASMLILFLCLYFIVRLMKSLIIGRVEIVFNNVLGKHGGIAILASVIFTAIIQSSSITTSLMVPLVASGVLTVESIFPIVLGANIGTTITAILASFATGNMAAITVAFAHFLFNFIGVLCFYPIPMFRKIPISLAKGLGALTLKKRRYAFIYVSFVFFLLPAILIFISKMLFK
ncbi:MAG: Na/Pi symporter [Candidatus Omnitrophica bacterium]|nr:Na/Pi symporter [Candidatus Omnitrophota bacterium]